MDNCRIVAQFLRTGQVEIMLRGMFHGEKQAASYVQELNAPIRQSARQETLKNPPGLNNEMKSDYKNWTDHSFSAIPAITTNANKNVVRDLFLALETNKSIHNLYLQGIKLLKEKTAMEQLATLLKKNDSIWTLNLGEIELKPDVVDIFEQAIPKSHLRRIFVQNHMVAPGTLPSLKELLDKNREKLNESAIIDKNIGLLEAYIQNDDFNAHAFSDSFLPNERETLKAQLNELKKSIE